MEYLFPDEVFSCHVNKLPLTTLSQNIRGDAICPYQFFEERYTLREILHYRPQDTLAARYWLSF